MSRLYTPREFVAEHFCPLGEMQTWIRRQPDMKTAWTDADPVWRVRIAEIPGVVRGQDARDFAYVCADAVRPRLFGAATDYHELLAFLETYRNSPLAAGDHYLRRWEQVSRVVTDPRRPDQWAEVAIVFAVAVVLGDTPEISTNLRQACRAACNAQVADPSFEPNLGGWLLTEVQPRFEIPEEGVILRSSGFGPNPPPIR